MNIHQHAKLTPHGRERMVRMMLSGQCPAGAARDAGGCPRTAHKWLARYRSSRPARLHNLTPDEAIARIIALPRLRLTGKHIARETGVSPATVSRVLKRSSLSRLKDLEPVEPVRRYERGNPGDLIHLDIKKLGCFESLVSEPRRR